MTTPKCLPHKTARFEIHMKPRQTSKHGASGRREAGATVALNVLVRDLNLDPVRQDDRRIEVIANGLPLWGGAQVAVDTTLVFQKP